MDQNENEKSERIAKRLARAGVCSRRDAERLIAEGRVMLNGEVLTSPAQNVTDTDIILVDGKPIAGKEPTRLWRYHKPAGLVTSHRDEQGRDTIFDHLPKNMPRVISVGRLDLNSEGLLLLTNDGEFSRQMELPATGLKRKYRVRALGQITQDKLDRLQDGIRVNGIQYGPIEAMIQSGTGANRWIDVTLTEGKNREIRKVFDHLGLNVNRLIRIAYGQFELGDLAVGAVEEVTENIVKKQL